jgi:hypothetical protein
MTELQRVIIGSIIGAAVVSLSAVFVGYLRIWAGTNAVTGIVARRSLGLGPSAINLRIVP